MTPLLEGELSSSAAESVRARILADPALSSELRRLELAVGSLHRFAPRAVPADLREELDLSLMIETKPQRARYGDLLCGTVKPREAAALRAEIAADEELASEFALLSAGLETWRAEGPQPVPASVRARIDRAIDFEQTRHIVPIPSRHPVLRQRWAMAGAAAVMLFGLIVARVGDRPGTPVTPVSPGALSQAAMPAPAPELAAPLAAPAAKPATAAPVVAPVAARPAPAVSQPSSSPVSHYHPKPEHKPTPPPPAKPELPPPPAAIPVMMASADTGSASSTQGSMPEPSTINAQEVGSSPLAINLASETAEPGF